VATRTRHQAANLADERSVGLEELALADHAADGHRAAEGERGALLIEESQENAIVYSKCTEKPVPSQLFDFNFRFYLFDFNFRFYLSLTDKS
jgi:hypothetical protein